MPPTNPEVNALEDTGREYAITRVLDAPRELVFRAWTDPKQMAKWWQPKCSRTRCVRWTCVRAGPSNSDARAGRRSYPFKGTYLEVVANERLVFTDDCSEHPEA